MKITSKEMLIKHIEEHKGRNVPLFTAYGNHGYVLDDTIKSHHKITIKGNDVSIFDYVYLDDVIVASLHDRHISGTPQNYNDNWWFTTAESAQEYLANK